MRCKSLRQKNKMEATKKRHIKSGEEFEHLFPKPLFLDPLIKKGATVNDTVRFIPKVVGETLFHTSKIAARLKGKNDYETCRNIWDFVYTHIAYKKDEEGKEQIRSPARAWYDRRQGVDCDCYTTFISSILSNLNIRHKLRITKYKEEHFQHIYPIVPRTDGTYITVDCVVNKFNYEEPYSEKQDTDMDLEYLNGVPAANNVDVEDLMGWEELQGGDLGKLKILKKVTQSVKKINPPPILKKVAQLPKAAVKKVSQTTNKVAANVKKANVGAKVKTVAKKALHVTNRVNPATALLREGILLSMKLNLFQVASRLKYAYLSDEQAKQKEIDMAKFAKLKQVREKLEKIFYGAGGKPENLKSAILTGKGNQNHEVSGLGYIADDMSGLDGNSPANILLGEIFYDENLNGFGELGSATATAAAITAATSVMGAIAGLLKGIGNIFPNKKSKASKDFETPAAKTSANTSQTSSKDNSASDNANSYSPENSSPDDASNNKTANEDNGTANDGETESNENGEENENSDAVTKTANTSSSNSNTENKNASSGNNKLLGFWQKNKKWLKPTAIGIAGAGLLALGYKMMSKKKTKTSSHAGFGQLNGIKTRKKQKKKGGNQNKKKEAIAFM